IYTFSNTSKVNEEWINRPTDGLGENETWVLKGTNSAANISVGDNIYVGLQFPTPKFDNTTTVYVNLTVGGFLQLTDKGYQLISGNNYYVSPAFITSGSTQIYYYQSDLMVVSWENTLQKIWDVWENRTISATFLVNLDHQKLLSPWNTQASADNVETIANDIHNKVLANYEINGQVQNNLGNALMSFQYNFQSTLINFIVVSIPVFFIAWYLGYTVSDVSFNMRRREIGLLSTKGLSSGQIQRMFLTEALTIGVAGGIIGVIGGLVLNQVFTGEFNLNTLFNPRLMSPYTMAYTVIFGAVLGFLSVFFSARKAAKLPTVEALREYLPVETDRPYRKRLPWIAFILGLYKIIIFIIGVNVPNLLSNLIFQSGNYFLSILVLPVSVLDQILTYIGPLLFFWGITKLLIQNTTIFQRLSSKISSALGDLGALAAKNVRRNAARAAAIAFLIALIVGYSVQVTGELATQNDYIVRQVQSSVGADLSVSVFNATLVPQILADIEGNVSGIQQATLQARIMQNSAGTVVETIEPESWFNTAYYEKDLFTGASVPEMIEAMQHDNMTIILERRVAEQLDLKVGDTVGIDFASGARKLTIVGLFGPAPSSSSSGISPGSSSFTLPTWSYIPRNLFNTTAGSDAYILENFDAKILLKLDPGVNGTKVAEQIRSLDLELYGVTSFDEQWHQSQSFNDQTTFYSLQVLDVQNLGVIFAVLSATVGTALVAVVSLRERSREATLMSVRGLSYKQIVWMLLNENMVVITFSVILGIAVGLLVDYGSVASTVGITSQLVVPHFMFPDSAITTVAVYIGLIYAASIITILVMSSQYVTKLEKMVRMK
ncbi:MAG: ABC transporter permease, partial [Planctomycetes bacterium]|nr:ABC transporter permease [Planctomycetota bacterium]